MAGRAPPRGRAPASLHPPPLPPPDYSRRFRLCPRLRSRRFSRQFFPRKPARRRSSSRRFHFQLPASLVLHPQSAPRAALHALFSTLPAVSATILLPFPQL